ncbi:MAG: hypothetical protein OEY87_09900 [Gammaproteobacteria bacterium]|nr:hypothetical protein [Gammaproteobacteria bacterium]MDH5736422.1 hypothetical protein [Gammaproteobacteria bacterium]
MASADFWNMWVPGQPATSIVIWVVIFMLGLYVARIPAHQAILTITQGLRHALRLMAKSVMLVEKRLKQRNSEVLLAHGREATERYIEREFQRVEALVNRDLSGYPSLQRDLKEQITRIDEDYVQSGEVPPQPPEWLRAIEAVAEIPSNGSPVVAKILNDIHSTLRKSLDKDVSAYRKANKERHELLKKMMPYWRSLTKILTNVEKKITGLENRSNIIDEQMKHYEEILAKTDYAERMLSSSSLTQFFISGLVLFIAIIGGYVNFQLVALPMSEMVGAGSYLGSIKSSNVAALFIIALEVSLGLFLMEAVGVTRLFPVISTLDDKKRKVILWVSLSFLFVFASIESSLAYMRDMLAADKEALTQMLSGVEVAEPEFRWIPSVGQMVMGFILPFALTFAAIPLESFIHSSRTVIGLALVWLLNSLSFIIRQMASLIKGVGQLIVNVYDLFIFIPLRIEQLFKKNKESPDIGSVQNNVFIKN